MKQATVAISADFLTAFAALPRQIQGKVTKFINKFRNNPCSSGINYEKIQNAADKKICSVRIDDTYRGIVVRQEESGVYLLLWVDHHDEAYDWARSKKCEINKATGNIQVFDIVIRVEQFDSGKDKLFAQIDDATLIKFGLPEEQIIKIRKIESLKEFIGIKSFIPTNVYEVLEWIANGFDKDEVIAMYQNEIVANTNDNFALALQTEIGKQSFVVVEGEDELNKIMAEPLEKWRIFLHPTQRKIVFKDFSGSARVTGGAGTGKTVVAIHRAKWLASQIKNNKKVLFTTFTANLAGDILDNLRKICSIEELRKIEVVNLDALLFQLLREYGYTYSIGYDDSIELMMNDAITRSGENIEFSVGFFMEEWQKIVASQEVFSKEQYFRVSRLGRGTRLTRKKRIQVWHVFEEYINVMREKQIKDVDSAMFDCRKILENNKVVSKYCSIIVDEGQDLSMNAYRLLRRLAGAEHNNDIFIVGDAQQRIYKNKAVLSKCGINIRGRSHKLRINYRTTEEIRNYAFSLLKNISFDNLDNEYEKGNQCQSLTHGNLPIIKNFANITEENQYIIKEVNRLVSEGVSYKNICIVARTHKLLNNYITEFAKNGIKVFKIKRSKLDDRSFDGIRVATMHRVKGLEFNFLFVVAANNRIIPLVSAISHSDNISEVESLTSERCLLYVALTRAQKAAYITSYGQISEFIR